MSKFNRLASFLLQLLLVASLASAEELKDHIENLDLSRPRTSLEKDQSKEINITDIIQILEEHEQDLTDLRITQGHTSEVTNLETSLGQTNQNVEANRKAVFS